MTLWVWRDGPPVPLIRGFDQMYEYYGQWNVSVPRPLGTRGWVLTTTGLLGQQERPAIRAGRRVVFRTGAEALESCRGLQMLTESALPT